MQEGLGKVRLRPLPLYESAESDVVLTFKHQHQIIVSDFTGMENLTNLSCQTRKHKETKGVHAVANSPTPVVAAIWPHPNFFVN